MKRNTTYKNLFDIMIAVIFLSWVMFEIIALGNELDIFSYPGFSGVLIYVTGRLAPVVALYVFLSVWGDVRGVGGFFERAMRCDDNGRVAAVTVLYALLHGILCLVFGERAGGAPVLPAAFVYSLITAGLSEVLWTGIVLPAFWSRISFVPACMINGFLFFLYCLPLWFLEGLRGEMGEAPHFYVYCCYNALMLGCVYRMTRSILACVLVRSVMQMTVYYYSDAVFGSGGMTIVLMAELVLLSGVMVLSERRRKRG